MFTCLLTSNFNSLPFLLPFPPPDLLGNGAVARYLKQAEISTISNSQCRNRWGIFFSPIRSTNICVFDSSGVHGACSVSADFFLSTGVWGEVEG